MARGLDTFHSDYLYRVLRPNESPDKNLVCCNRSSLRSIDQHVETGLIEPSIFISTTSDFNAALKWLDKANEKCILRYLNVRRVIVRIDVKLLKWKYSLLASNAYDLSNSLNRDRFLKTEKQKKFSESYHEVVFIGEIPSDVFSTYYILGEGLVRNQALNKTASSISSSTSIKPPSLLQSAFPMGDISDLGETSNDQISSTSGLSFQPVNKHRIGALRTSLPITVGASDTTTPAESKYLHSALTKSMSYVPKNNSDSVAAHSRISSAGGFSFLPVNKPSSDALKTNTPNSGATSSSEPDPPSFNYVQYASPAKKIQTIQKIDSKEAADRRMLFASSFNSTLLSNKPHVDTLRANKPIPCPTPNAQFSPAISKYLQPPSSMSKIIPTTSPSPRASDRSLFLADKPRIDTVALKSESNVNPDTKLTKYSSSPNKTTSLGQEMDSSKVLRNSLYPQTSYKPILYPPSYQPIPSYKPTALINKATRKTVRPINSAESISPYEPTLKKSSTFLSNYIQSSNSREIKASPKMIADINESKVGSPKSTLLPTTDSAGTSQFKLHEINEAFAQSLKGKDIPSTLDVNCKQLNSDFEASMKIVKKTLLLHSKLFRLN